MIHVLVCWYKKSRSQGAASQIFAALKRRLGAKVAHRGLAGAAVFFGIEGNFLAFHKIADSSAFECRCVHEHVLAAVIRLDEAKAFLTVVEFYCASVHSLAFG